MTNLMSFYFKVPSMPGIPGREPTGPAFGRTDDRLRE